MALDQGGHRDKRYKIAEDIEENSTSSSTLSASRPNVQPPTPLVPIDPLNTSTHCVKIHHLAAQSQSWLEP